MSYIPLIKECKEAIATGRCLGCQNLENPNFMGNKNCKYNNRKEIEGKQLQWKI